MSSFGGVRLPIRTHRRRNAASNSPPSSPKRKPFAPSSVSVDMSGPPPPLPPVAKAEVSQEKLADSSPGQSVTAQEFLDATFGMGLQIMSPRWLQLTAVLWSIFVVDANRSVDRAALRNFLDAIEWRISGQITEQEFLSLYSEWMAANYAPLKRRSSIGINQLRHLLLGKSCGEGELDLILGALLFENSRSLLNRPLSFSDGAMTKAARNALDICSRRWLALAEELFFALDAPGYGCLQYDQVFFFAACLVLGLRSWSDSTEVESDLSIGVLTAITANIIKDACYAHTGGLNAANALNLSAQEEGAAGGSSAPLTPGRRGAIAPENATVTSGGNNFGEGVWSGYNPSTNNTAATWCVGMTMPIFKSYLIKMGIGETVLMTLLEHVRDTLAVITSRLSSWSDTSSSERPAAAALQACVPVELAGKGWRVARDGVAAPPLLWQSTLLRVSGWVSGREPLDHEDLHGASDQPIVYSQISRPLQSKDGSDYNEHSLSSINRLKDSEWLGVVSQINENDDPLPPILSFLMSDGDNLVPMALRAYGDTIMAFDALNASPEVAGMQVLHNTVWKLVRAFKKWGQVGGTTPLNIDFQVQGIPSVDLRKDPIYQFILTAITEYKKLQLCLCSAFSDVALSGSGGIVKDDYSSDKLAQSSSVVALACAALLPRGEIILNEFQAYEKIINTGSPTSKPFISVKRNSMIKSRGSKWEAFAMDVKTTPEKVPTGAIEIEAEAEAVDQADDAEKPPSPTAPLLARRAPPHRRASAPVISSTQSLDFIKRSDGLQLIRAKDDGDARAKDIPNKKPFSSLSGLFTEVSVDSASAVAGEGNNPGVQAPTVHATSAAAVASSSYEDVLKYIEESSPNWTPADANLIAGAKWKSVRGDTSPADGESTTRGASADSSTRSNFSAEADKLQRKIVDLILASNPEVSIEQREHLKGIVAQSMPPVEHGRDAQQSSQKSKRSAAVTRLEDELKAEQSYAIREDNIGGNLLSTPARALRGIHDKVSPASSFGERSGAVSDGEQMDASTASSVIELLQQGHSAGQYAQTLRDLLRRMSKKNSNLQLKTLEDIIKLGESIVAQDRANQSTSQPAETSTGRYGFGHIRHGSGGGNRAKQGINHSGHSSLETPPANTKYFAETEGTEDYFDSEAKSSLLGEDVPFGRSGKLPKSRIISFMDEVITDVGGNSPARMSSRGMANRTASVPGRAPGLSPSKHRGGGSGMSRGLKAKPPPPKVRTVVSLF